MPRGQYTRKSTASKEVQELAGFKVTEVQVTRIVKVNVGNYQNTDVQVTLKAVRPEGATLAEADEAYWRLFDEANAKLASSIEEMDINGAKPKTFGLHRLPSRAFAAETGRFATRSSPEMATMKKQAHGLIEDLFANLSKR